MSLYVRLKFARQNYQIWNFPPKNERPNELVHLEIPRLRWTRPPHPRWPPAAPRTRSGTRKRKIFRRPIRKRESEVSDERQAASNGPAVGYATPFPGNEQVKITVNVRNWLIHKKQWFGNLTKSWIEDISQNNTRPALKEINCCRDKLVIMPILIR